jgi:hypothetical protein
LGASYLYLSILLFDGLGEVWYTEGINNHMEVFMDIVAQTRQPQRGLTFEDVWAMFQETDRIIKENAAQMKETDKKIEALGKQVGGLHRSPGDLIETLMASRLWEKFPLYNFNRTFQRIKIFDKNKVSLHYTYN